MYSNNVITCSCIQVTSKEKHLEWICRLNCHQIILFSRGRIRTTYRSSDEKGCVVNTFWFKDLGTLFPFCFKNLGTLFPFCFNLHLHSHLNTMRRRYVPCIINFKTWEVEKLMALSIIQRWRGKGHTDFITETLQAPICCCLIDSPLAEKLAENSKHIKRQFPCVSNDLCAS